MLERDVLQQRVLNAPSTVSLRCGRYIDEDRPCSHEDGNPITERQGHRHLVRAAAGVTARDRGSNTTAAATATFLMPCPRWRLAGAIPYPVVS